MLHKLDNRETHTSVSQEGTPEKPLRDKVCQQLFDITVVNCDFFSEQLNEQKYDKLLQSFVSLPLSPRTT